MGLELLYILQFLLFAGVARPALLHRAVGPLAARPARSRSAPLRPARSHKMHSENAIGDVGWGWVLYYPWYYFELVPHRKKKFFEFEISGL